VHPEALLVHRLDRDTSGVMIFALTPHAQRHLGLQFEKRQVRKAYVARVWGTVAEDAGRIDLPLIVDWPNRPLQKVDHETGRPAVTDWRVLRIEDGHDASAALPAHRPVAPACGSTWPRSGTRSWAIPSTPRVRRGTSPVSCCIPRACASGTPREAPG
jgi:hypothetical protein